MIFIPLDSKEWCRGIYTNGSLYFDRIPEGLSKTWKYHPALKGHTVEYASLYCQNASIDEVCPEHLKDLWQQKTKRLKAFYKSFLNAKINLEDVCLFDIVPEQFMLEFSDLKSQIIEHVFKEYKKPSNYDFLVQLQQLVWDISQRQINLDLESMKKNLSLEKYSMQLSKIKNVSNKVDYNIFGTKTGRLTTKKGTFPILNFDSAAKVAIKPANNLYVEMDFNAAEARILLALSGQNQPGGDIHKKNADLLGLTREKAKKELFSWLYGSTRVDSFRYEKLFQVKKVMTEFYDGKNVSTPYGRIIASDDFHSLNYLIQSTTSDMVLKQILKIQKFLENKKSFIAFMVHDSVVIDLAKEELELIKYMSEEFSKTDFGSFPVNISAGKNYGELRNISCL